MQEFPNEPTSPERDYYGAFGSLLGLVLRTVIFNAAIFATITVVEVHLFATDVIAAFDPIARYVEVLISANVAFGVYLLFSILAKASAPTAPLDGVIERPTIIEERTESFEKDLQVRLALDPAERMTLDRLAALAEAGRNVRILRGVGAVVLAAMAVSFLLAAGAVVFAAYLTSIDSSVLRAGSGVWDLTVVRLGVPLVLSLFVVLLMLLFRQIWLLVVHFAARRDLFTVWDGSRSSLKSLELLVSPPKFAPPKRPKPQAPAGPMEEASAEPDAPRDAPTRPRGTRKR